MPNTKKTSKKTTKSSAHVAKRKAATAKSKPAKAVAAAPASRVQNTKASAVSAIIPTVDKGRALFLAIIVIVAVAGTVMLVPKQTNTSATAAALQHIVTYQGQDGKNALDLLKAHHQVAAQEFSIGSFVTAIDGISAPANYFWAFSVNGKASDVGPDQYITKNGDMLKWQLERIQ